MNMKRIFARIFQTPSVNDPDDARRRGILNILLVSTFILTILGLIFATLVFLFSETGFSPADIQLIYFSGPVLLVITVIIYVVNRFVSGKLAGTLFLLFLLILFVFTDSPDQVSNGRTLFVFAIPVVISSLLLNPGTSFIFAGLSSIEISLLSYSISQPPNTPAIVGFFLLAVVSWLSARSLEQALKELRQINVELDRRVEDRTRELSAALTRELIEAGKSQAILEGIADGVVVFDTNGKSIVANPSLSRLLDVPASRLMNASMREILVGDKITPQDRETILSLVEDPSQESPSVRFRWGKSTLLVNASQVTSGLGDLIGTVAVFRDFTREAEVEQMKNTFVAMISHELRTPLNAILGYTEMMREAVYGPISRRQAGVVERIASSSQRLLGIVSDLLDQAQIEAGRMKIHIADFQVSDLVGALRAYLDKPATDKGLRLSVAVDPNLPPVLRGDAQRLGQVLLNLSGNAVKFTERGGVDVHLFRVDEGRWGFDVTDTGPGIAPEDQQYVFESFRQVEHVATREHGGIGLGLAIVKNLVQLMGGEISLSSAVGKGSTFSVVFPFDVK